MRKLSPILRKSRQALQDLDLLKVLQSEIRHELSLNPFQVPPLLFVIYCLIIPNVDPELEFLFIYVK